jgi:hypothetical protein
MVALADTRFTAIFPGQRFTDPVKAAVNIFAGAMVVLDAGFAAPGRTAVGLKARGVAAAAANNSLGAAGAISVEVNKGVFMMLNDGSINRTHIGGSAYIVDDQTVAATDGTGTRSLAGEIMDVEATGVHVKF